jgi:hypothetical protein
MARIRTIQPHFPHSKSMRRVSREARLLFIQLWLAADDAGRLRAAPVGLADLLYPDDDDAPMLLPSWLDELERQGCLERYTVDDVDYLRVACWRKYQKIDRPTPSQLPASPSEPRGPREDSRAAREEWPESQMESASSGNAREQTPDQARRGITPERLLDHLEFILADTREKRDHTPGCAPCIWRVSTSACGPSGRRMGQSPAVPRRTSCWRPRTARAMRVDRARLDGWRQAPAAFVREVFGVVPDPWQEEVLEAFPDKPRIAMKACKGPGKTAVQAWLGWNFLATRRDAKIAATSITADNLADNLWSEMAKWRQRAPYLRDHFQWTKSRIFARRRPETWWMSARTWNRTADRNHQGNTLAGLHADNILFILDESGGIPDGVMATAEAALASCADGHIVQAGNPTHLEGPLYRACTSERRLWHVVEITADPDDARRSSRVKAEWAREQIEKYGRDNPWVLVNVFGRFPPGSLNSLIGPDECREASQRVYRPEDYRNAPRVLGSTWPASATMPR